MNALYLHVTTSYLVIFGIYNCVLQSFLVIENVSDWLVGFY